MIHFFDMFSGIGGFRAGLERVGGFTCVGHYKIDKYADKTCCAAYEAVVGATEAGTEGAL